MTRILVLGNSHAATLRRAFPRLQEEQPDLSLAFWGLPGGAFAKARAGADGCLRPDPSDAVSRHKVAQWNGTDHIDLAPFDRILLVGLRYGLRQSISLMRDLQPLDWGRRRRALGVSTGFLREAMRAEIRASLAAQAERLPMDARFVLMPSPYLAEAAVAGYPALATVAALPHAADLMALYEDEVAKAHADAGLAFHPQPRQTLSRPFLTADDFLEDPTLDARHMNAHYGLLALRAMLADMPEQTPAPPPESVRAAG